MREIRASGFVNAGSNLRLYQTPLVVADTQPGLDANEQIDAESAEIVRRDLQSLNNDTDRLGLRVTSAKVARVLESYEREPPTVRVLGDDSNDIRERLIDELESLLFLVVDPARARFYKEPLDGWESVIERFPTASFDIEEAGKCLALDRGTACVSHLMRVLELGLYALADDLEVENIQVNWQNAIEQIEKAIRGLDKGDSRTQPDSEAAAHLFNVKDAWRNSVAHAGQAYPVDKAEQILANVKAFMQTLATHLGESS